ncbi:hypothetical protein EC991_010629 [Linnemannia zychae]|nr:hypothetical protein EC991_010629 [Linnemannia zychae]
MFPADPLLDSGAHITSIPEVMAKFRFYLSPPDLYSCVQVSHLWHNVFMSALWETIDDTLYAWPKILEDHDSDEARGDKDIDWINDVFAKYGSFICHLRLSWPVMIEAAYTHGRCTRLLSLRILSLQLTTKQKCEPVPEDVYNDEDRGSYFRRFVPSATGPLLSPIFVGAFKAASASRRSEAQQLQNWRITQVYWLLILANVNLRTLGLDPMLSCIVHEDSRDFLYDSLAKLSRLEHVDMVFSQPDLNRLLERQPSLRCFCNSGALTSNIGAPTRTFSQIVWFSTCTSIGSSLFFMLLKWLPNLEFLRFPGMRCENVNAAAIMEGELSRLKILHMYNNEMKRADRRFATRFLPWIPELVEFSTMMLWPETTKILAEKNPKLETFRQSTDLKPISRHHKLLPKINVASTLLESSSSLKTFNGILHRISARHLVTHSWACVRLEVFRCQIVGLPSLSRSDRTALHKLFIDRSFLGEEATPPSARQIRALEKAQHWFNMHTLVYDRLASLIHLTVLDLGWNPGNPDDQTVGRPYNRWGESYVHDSLELTLKSGLKRLAPLTSLKVFGFDGVNHNIGRRELEWMAKSWPQLKVMRGLHVPAEPARVVFYCPRKVLREYMQTLRPDIIHEAAPPLTFAEYEDSTLTYPR